MSAVIIGAGPAGLSLAIQLKRRGVQDVVVYDARKGQYLRPGVLNAEVFEKAGVSIESKEYDYQGDYQPNDLQQRTKPLHIKELERKLYDAAVEEGVQFQPYNFVNLYQDPEKPGIIINQDGKEVKVEADFVFDCTGTKREVVHAVNRLIPDSPMKLTEFTDIPVPNQLLAYVKMAESDLHALQLFNQDYVVDNLSDLSFTLAMHKLHKLGWDKWKFPRIVAHDFEKEKVCLYSQAPNVFTENQYDPWLEAVLGSYALARSDLKINYEHLIKEESKETQEKDANQKTKAEIKEKLRFKHFPMGGQVLDRSAYKGKNLPTVIALGDAQIDSDYILGEGISHGLDRLEKLFDSLIVDDGIIEGFDPAQYQSDIHHDLANHKKRMIQEVDSLKESFSQAKILARQRFINVLTSNTTDENKNIALELLKKLVGKQSVDIFAMNLELATVFFKAKNYKIAIDYGIYSLTLQQSLGSRVPNKLPEILNILVNAFNEEAQRVLTSNPGEAQELYLQVKDLFEVHSDKLEDEEQKNILSGQLEQLADSIKHQLNSVESKPQESSSSKQSYSNQRLFKNKKDDDVAEDRCNCSLM